MEFFPDRVTFIYDLNREHFAPPGERFCAIFCGTKVQSQY